MDLVDTEPVSGSGSPTQISGISPYPGQEEREISPSSLLGSEVRVNNDNMRVGCGSHANIFPRSIAASCFVSALPLIRVILLHCERRPQTRWERVFRQRDEYWVRK